MLKLLRLCAILKTRKVFCEVVMNKENSRKIKLLKMWEILKSETDEEHPISTNELIERLGREGIEVDRKILYADIDLLKNGRNFIAYSRSAILSYARSNEQIRGQVEEIYQGKEIYALS